MVPPARGRKWPGETERRGREGEAPVREEGGMKQSEQWTPRVKR